jgi:hypothetical protein
VDIGLSQYRIKLALRVTCVNELLRDGAISPLKPSLAGAAPWRGPAAIQRLLDLKELFFLDVAEARPDTAAIDHYPDFLGHAANANIKDCPHCGQDNTQWTDPLGIYPNGAGQTHVPKMDGGVRAHARTRVRRLADNPRLLEACK